jgi:hypothetical protein
MSLRPGELSPGSRNLVLAETSTVTVVLFQPAGVIVKLAVTAGSVEAVVVRTVEVAVGAERTVPVMLPPEPWRKWEPPHQGATLPG